MAETFELADSAVADALGGACAQRLGPLLAVSLAGREHVSAGPEDLVGDGDGGLLVVTAAFKCFGIVLDYQPVRRRHFQEPRVFSEVRMPSKALRELRVWWRAREALFATIGAMRRHPPISEKEECP
jgi:hypothetical protein